MYLITCNF